MAFRLKSRSKEQLIDDTSNPSFQVAHINKLEHDQPFAERSRANVYQMVIERIVKYDSRSSPGHYGNSLTRASEIKAT